MMWFLLLLYIAHIEPVILKVENRLILRNGNNPCEGHIEIYHGGESGYLGDKHWSRNTEEVVCRSTHCGKPVENSARAVLRPIDSKVWLNEVKCEGSESHLWDCDFPGWGISAYQKDTVKKIKCTNTIEINLDGFSCAGAVRYSTDGGTPSGYFCDENWGQDDANILCESLGCGKSKEIPKEPWKGWKEFQSLKKMTINCSGIENVKNLWQCATQETSSCKNPASVICTGYNRLQLKGNTSNVCSGQLEIEQNGNWNPVKSNTTSPDEWCQQMHCGANVSHSQDDNGTTLTCTDNVKVLLMDKGKPSTCYGEVYIEVNADIHPVCASSWTSKIAQVVCRERNCGDVIHTNKVDANRVGNIQGIMDYVKCSGNESSLWHCRAKRNENPFSCGSKAYVVCADSIKVRLMDSPGRCAGRVEIQHKGLWERVNKEQWHHDTASDVVCRQLGCGNKANPISPEKFNQGSGDFLAKTVKCKPDALDISQCLGELSSQPIRIPKEAEALGITCEDHNMVFLKGNDSCSGMVGVAHGIKTYWLSGSNETWNQESANAVCRQMQCGKASAHNFISKADMPEDVWTESYNCLSNSTSLFECEKTTLPSNHSDTIATVKCSGEIKVNLTNKCWGYVNVCVQGKCGGVCADTWTEQKSVMLCKNLGCGDIILKANNPKKYEVIIKSLHTTEQTTNLNQCNLVKYAENDDTCNQKPAYVVCSGSVKPKISLSRDKCSGNVNMHFAGNWLPVCKEALEDTKTQNTICAELKCGQAVSMTTFGPNSTEKVISQIQCPANGMKSLTACNITSKKHSCPPGVLQCSSWSKMSLKDGESCSGKVYVHSEGKIIPVSTEGWTQTEGNRLCQDLECGNLKSNKNDTGDYIESRSFSCQGVGNPENIWDCEKQNSISQQQVIVACEGNVKFNTTEKCGGQIEVNYQNKWEKVCLPESISSEFQDQLCEKLNCTGALPRLLRTYKKEEVNLDTTLNCSKDHKDINHCVHNKTCQQVQPAEIYCHGYVRPTPGPVTPTTINIVPIILGVGFLLVLMILIVVFIRICIVKKAKNISSKMLSRKEVEFESGDYEDVTNEANELEDFVHGRFRSDAEVIMESDERSNASFSYDDIDEAAKARPLTSQAATAGAAGDNYIHERTLDLSTDGVTYEVDDPQENYDDIEASPEMTQTKAEVHDSPQTAPESAAAAPPGLVQADEDYLVPGQDW
ncbi:scavenger receptor cysteine-rich type 1 protein M160-like [Siniperca chuatsi]|uniref:scavenger receptor cysteine-rich type 1 protein M160-like n=1 Tax=Siniperca chuatsi TaxID=119488 RepID=UPI001CE04424|nr:scavenger receptor cysteine-rich type 1 protein M160-like [Siniperca chuatsi]